MTSSFCISRRGLTGLETAIILVAFVITASAFTFIVLNMGAESADRVESVISSSIRESSSSLLLDSSLIGSFSNNTGPQSGIVMTKLVFYVKLGQGGSPLIMSDDRIVITYSNLRIHCSVYDQNGTIATVKGVTGDRDNVLEPGERFKVEIDFTKIDKDKVDPPQTWKPDIYTKPYEEFTVEILSESGARLTIRRRIPTVTSPAMGF